MRPATKIERRKICPNPIQIAGLIWMLVCVTGCSPSYVTKYGTAFNSEREKKGVPAIPASWTMQDMGSYFDCSNPNPNKTSPHRLMKRVFVDPHGNIASETDSFYSGKTFYFEPEQMTLPQKLIVEYDYAKEATGTPWTVYADLDPIKRSQRISIEEADSILTSWGLSRKK